MMCFLLMLAVLPHPLWGIQLANFLLFAFAISGRAAILRSKLLLFLGAISYSLYVVHSILRARIQAALLSAGIGAWLNVGIAAAAVIAVATALTYTIERPVGLAIRRAYAG